MRRIRIVLVRAVAACLCLHLTALSLRAAPILVDTFSQPPGGQAVTSGPLTGTLPSVTGLGVLGTRDVSYTGTNASTGNTFRTGVLQESLAVNDPSLPGRLALSTFDSAVQVNLKYSGFGTLDLTGMGTLDLIFNTIFDKGAGASFDVTVTLTTGSGTRSGTLSAPVSFAPLGGTLSIPLSSLTGPGNLATVNQIQINLNDNGTPSAGADFAIDAIQFAAIPEPASLAAWGFVGLAGAWYGRRRLRRKQEA